MKRDPTMCNRCGERPKAIYPSRVGYLCRRCEVEKRLAWQEGNRERFNEYRRKLGWGKRYMAEKRKVARQSSREEYKAKHGKYPPPPKHKYSHAFDAFWTTYPHRRRASKYKCYQKWKSYGLDQEGRLEKVLECLQEFTASPDWLKEGGEFIPMATTWLNRKHWLDRPPSIQEVPLDGESESIQEPALDRASALMRAQEASREWERILEAKKRFRGVAQLACGSDEIAAAKLCMALAKASVRVGPPDEDCHKCEGTGECAGWVCPCMGGEEPKVTNSL